MKKRVIYVTRSLPILFDYSKGRYYERGDIIENYTTEMEKVVINNPHAFAFIEKDYPDVVTPSAETNVIKKVEHIVEKIVEEPLKEVEKAKYDLKHKKEDLKNEENKTDQNVKNVVDQTNEVKETDISNNVTESSTSNQSNITTEFTDTVSESSKNKVYKKQKNKNN